MKDEELKIEEIETSLTLTGLDFGFGDKYSKNNTVTTITVTLFVYRI